MGGQEEEPGGHPQIPGSIYDEEDRMPIVCVKGTGGF